MKEMKASMDVIRKTAGEMIDQLTEELEIILEEKQKTELHEKYGILVDALEAYEKIPSERMYGLKCVGFDLKDGSDYEGMQSLMIEEKNEKELNIQMKPIPKKKRGDMSL